MVSELVATCPYAGMAGQRIDGRAPTPCVTRSVNGAIGTMVWPRRPSCGDLEEPPARTPAPIAACARPGKVDRRNCVSDAFLAGEWRPRRARHEPRCARYFRKQVMEQSAREGQRAAQAPRLGPAPNIRADRSWRRRCRPGLRVRQSSEADRLKRCVSPGARPGRLAVRPARPDRGKCPACDRSLLRRVARIVIQLRLRDYMDFTPPGPQDEEARLERSARGPSMSGLEIPFGISELHHKGREKKRKVS